LANIYSPYFATTVQWRKDGKAITGYTMNLSLIFTNLRASDTGVYDGLKGIGYGPGPAQSSKVYLSVQIKNGEGVFRPPHTTGSNFAADFEGAAGRN